MTQKVVKVNGKEVAVSGTIKNAFMRGADEDRERKRCQRLAQKGIEPELSSLDAMYEETGFEVQSDDNVEESVMRILMSEQVRKAVVELPENKRVVIELRYFKGMSVRDTADALHIPPSTAGSREKSALADLKKLLQKFV